MSNAKGKGEEEKGNAYYTASLLMMGILTAVFWGILLIFHRQIFTFFGADEIIMPKALEYARWVIWFTPIFIAPTFLSSFIRNDGAPGLTMAAVIFGGGVNVFGDWFLVFPMGMGMKGAAIAPGWMWVPRWRTRMLPARTNCPSARFTPRRLALESRPFLVEPPPFLWAKNWILSFSIVVSVFSVKG